MSARAWTTRKPGPLHLTSGERAHAARIGVRIPPPGNYGKGRRR